MRKEPGFRLAARGGARSWWLFWLAVLGAIPAAVIAVTAGTPLWLQFTLLCGGPILGLLAVELKARRAQDDAAATVVREQVAGASERLPRMAAVDVADVHVHPAVHDVGYVTRDAEPAVADALRTRRRVLIAGASMSGKTRLAFQVTRSTLPEHRLYKPSNGRALHALLTGGLQATDLVVWLDDVDGYLGADGISAEDLEAFSPPSGRAPTTGCCRGTATSRPAGMC